MVAVSVESLGRAPPPDGALRVTVLDVGQGDAALIELPDVAVLLIEQVVTVTI